MKYSDVVSANINTGVSPYASDSFEDATVGASVNGRSVSGGITWGSWQGSPGTPSAYQGVISSDVAHTGTKSLKIGYLGVAAGADCYSENYIALKPSGQGLGELWIGWYVYFPANFVWRKTEVPTNNKLCKFWPEEPTFTDTGMPQFVQAYQLVSGAAHSQTATEAWVGGAPDNSGAPANIAGDLWDGNDSSVADAWHYLQIHVRVANGSDNGACETWWDGTQIYQLNVDAYPYAGNTYPWVRNGYLMGWANAGFGVDTVFYLDDFEFYDVAPTQWGYAFQ